jgi:hypothetical protein
MVCTNPTLTPTRHSAARQRVFGTLSRNGDTLYLMKNRNPEKRKTTCFGTLDRKDDILTNVFRYLRPFGGHIYTFTLQIFAPACKTNFAHSEAIKRHLRRQTNRLFFYDILVGTKYCKNSKLYIYAQREETFRNHHSSSSLPPILFLTIQHVIQSWLPVLRHLTTSDDVASATGAQNA